MSVYGYFSEAILFGKKKHLPAEYKLTVEDFNKASVFKKKVTEIVNYMNKEGFTKEESTGPISALYWGVLGNTFAATGSAVRYEPKMNFLAPIIKKYCIDKHIKRIKNDMEKTITALEKKDPNSMTPVQKAYYADIKSAVGKL